MARPSVDRQLFQENAAQALSIALKLRRCGAGMDETVFRTKGIIAETRALIALADQLLADPMLRAF